MIEWDEQKQVAKYGNHASVIAANVVSVLKKKQPSALYHGAYELISISNGKAGFPVRRFDTTTNIFTAQGLYLLANILGADVWKLGVSDGEVEGPLSFLDSQELRPFIIE